MLQLVFCKKIQNRQFSSQRTLAPPPGPFDRNALDEGGIPKVCTDCGYFCQLLTLAITSLIGVEMNGLQLDLWAKGFQDGNYFDTILYWSVPLMMKTAFKKLVKTASVASNCQSGLNVGHVFVVSCNFYSRGAFSSNSHLFSNGLRLLLVLAK